MKNCSRCGVEKDPSEFYIEKRNKLGLSAKCKQCCKDVAKKWREDNPGRNQQNCRAGYARNKLERISNVEKWRSENMDKSRSYKTKNRASRAKRTVTWANYTRIREFYIKAPDGHHVDHVIPLLGELVSGLHVHYNLQYLEKSENLSKHNKFDPSTFDNDSWLRDFLINN